MTAREAMAFVLAVAIGTPLLVLLMPYAAWVLAVWAAMLGGI